MSDIPDRFVQLDAVYMSPDYACYTIGGVRPYKGEMVLLRLIGVDNADAAESLRNRELCIPLDQLAQLPANSYYQHDIVGLQVCTLDEREVGVIVDIMPTGGNDVYVIKAKDEREFLVPAVREMIKQIDLVRQRMYIDPIEGLLDDKAVVDDSNKSTEKEVE